MEDTELLMNIIALGILVITAITNIGIQLGTGVIFEFWMEHALIMVLMVVLLAILCSLSLAIPTKKCFLDTTYASKLKKANKVCFTQTHLSAAERLKKDLGNYWMMAYTSSPQFVIGRSAPCSAAGAFCLVNLLILTESILRSQLMPWSFKFCNGDSDYKWSTTMVLMCQTVAVAVGTISPALRWFMTINFRCPTKASQASRQEFVVEKYWIKPMLLWQLQPLDLRIFNRKERKLIHYAKFHVCHWLIGLQKGLVFCCKMIRYVSIFFVAKFLRIIMILKGNNGGNNDDAENHNRDMNMDMRRYVIYLEGEEEFMDMMTEKNFDATAHWIKMGVNRQPRNLINLLERSSSLSSFNGVHDFDSDKVPSLCSREPPNCWALPIVTLTSIAVAIPNIDKQLIDQLIFGVDEGLKYVKEMEIYLENAKELKFVRKAAEIVWSGVELCNKWLDVDLSKVAQDQEHAIGTEIIKSLAEISKEKSMEIGNKDTLNECFKMAANSMYRICETLLLTSQNETNDMLFEKISLLICDILLAALSNLQHVISRKCHESKIEEREKSIRSAILLFGKTKRILEVIDMKRPEDSDHGKLIHIDEWHLVSKRMERLYSMSSSTDEDTTPYNPSDMCILIE